MYTGNTEGDDAWRGAEMRKGQGELRDVHKGREHTEGDDAWRGAEMSKGLERNRDE